MPILTFDEETHIYKLDGVAIPSVTQAIKGAGLMDLSFVSKELLEAKADLGKKIHTTTELYDRNNLDMNKLHPTLRGYLNAWIKFEDECQFIPTSIEMMKYHPLYRYAGRIDRIGMMQNVLTQVDLKSGVHHPSYAIQSAAYVELCNYGKPKAECIKKRITVYLKEDGTYQLKEYKDERDIRIFLASLTINNYLHK